jgi:pheromone shutdown protein TraB
MTTEERMNSSTADDRYEELLDQIRAISPDANALALELDAFVGERLSEVQDSVIGDMHLAIGRLR